MHLRRKPKPKKIGYPRLIATVKEFGDVIVMTDDPRETQGVIWTNPPDTLQATSMFRYGPKEITIRTSEVVATRLAHEL